MLKFWSVINCVFVQWTKKLNLVICELSYLTFFDNIPSRVKQQSYAITTLDSGINVGHEQNVQIHVTKNPSNLKISVDPEKNQ